MSSRFFKRIVAPGLLGLGLLAVVLLAAVGGTSDASANNGVRGLERAIAAQEAHTDALLALDGVVGTGVGAGSNGTAIVFVFTESAGVKGIPSRVDGVTVVPTVTGEITALHHRPGHNGGPGGGGEDPPATPTPTPTPGPADTRAPIGGSSGTDRLITDDNRLFCTVGTLGARVSDGTNTYALSNAHVYALQGSIPVGTVSVGDDILHPGRVDLSSGCGTPEERTAAQIGTLYAWSTVTPGGVNTVDAALAKVSPDDVGVSTPSDGYGTPSSTTLSVSDLFFRQNVVKYGRTTGQTSGKVWAINVSVNVGYATGVARFDGQIAVRGGGFSAGGDSGSLVVTSNGNNPVGLLFAGGGNTTFLNPINDVLAKLSENPAVGSLTIDGE